MRQRLSRAGTASLIALGVLGFSTGAAMADSTMITGHVPTTPSTAQNAIDAPLWVYPTGGGAPPVMVAPSAPGGPSVLVIRDEPSLLRPVDMHFSTDSENGVTVVRGPLAR
ncbi:MAG TPA: hypothetical protein VNG52_02655 [Stellaceae bacterium]|nr:hypothetical protein [Stellaceae bacterium]